MWLYFDKHGDEKAKCKKCGDVMSCRGSSTSGLGRHLKTKHSIDATAARAKPQQLSTTVDVECQQSSSAAKKQKSVATSSASSRQPILQFTERESLEEIVSRLVALDGFAVHGVANSSYIRKSLKSKGYNFPTDKTCVMKLVHTFYDKSAKEKVKEEIKKLKQVKFSATLDEWTSLKNRRYLNVNPHSSDGKFFNLGLIRIERNCPAETIEELMSAKLSEFELSLSDVVAATTDGAAVMIKFGRLICNTSIHQECLNHGLHLAVMDVLFKKVPVTAPVHNTNANLYNINDDDECDEELNSDNSYSDSENDDDGQNAVFDGGDDGEMHSLQMRADINGVLKKIRKAVVTFKRSPVRNCVLQEYIKDKHGKEL